MKDKYIFWTGKLELNDPPREACIITLDKNDVEISREYFGNNPRIELKQLKDER